MRKLIVSVFTLLLATFLVACGGKVDEATAEKYTDLASNVVSLLTEGNYEEVHAMFNEEMKVGLSVEQMSELTPIIQQSGDFENIRKSSVQEKDGYYVCILVAKYSEEERIYTISFDQEDKIAGLYVK